MIVMLGSMLRRLRSPPAAAVAPTDVDALVRLAYQAVLLREPDEVGCAAYGADMRNGRDLEWLIRTLLTSSEFHALEARAKAPTTGSAVPHMGSAHKLSEHPPMTIDTRCSEAELQELWDHVSRTWSRLGEEEPHWSVLTRDEFRADALGGEHLDTFYRSGEYEVERLNAWLRRGGLAVAPDATCAEFGCGVGRITHALARQYARVVAFDVSGPHLRTARARMDATGVGNVDFVHVTDKESLATLRDIDVFYSIIALQHSPPPIILDVLQQAFEALRPVGYAFFQVPTFATDYSYSVSAHVEALRHGTNARGSGSDEMEVHFVPQSTVLDMAHRAGLRAVEVQPDASVGNLDRWISNTFLLARRA